MVGWNVNAMKSEIWDYGRAGSWIWRRRVIYCLPVGTLVRAANQHQGQHHLHHHATAPTHAPWSLVQPPGGNVRHRPSTVTCDICFDLSSSPVIHICHLDRYGACCMRITPLSLDPFHFFFLCKPWPLRREVQGGRLGRGESAVSSQRDVCCVWRGRCTGDSFQRRAK